MVKIIILVELVLWSITAAQDTVRSVVIDRYTQEPIAGAIVTLLNVDLNVIAKQISKTSGAFRFIGSGTFIRISSLGYRDTVLAIAGLTDTVYVDATLILRKEIVVTAQRHLSLAQDVPASIVSVTPKEITSRSPLTVDQSLRFIPGVTVTEDQVSIRGSSGYARAVGSRVLFLLDGMPFASADNGDIKFDAIPIMNIDRIEVVKGSGSVLYGSSALGGVINILTREPSTEFHGAVNSFGGIYDEPKYDQWKVLGTNRRFAAIELGASGTLADVGLLGSIAYRRNEGYRLGDDYYKWSGFAKSAISLTDVTNLTISGLYASDDRGGWLYWRDLSHPLLPRDSLAAINERITSRKAFGSVVVRSFLSGAATLTSKGSILHTEFRTAPKREGALEGPHSSATGYNLDIELSSDIIKSVFLTSGIAAIYQAVSSDLFQSHKGYLFGAFAQGEYTMSPAIFTGGLRIDAIKYDTSSIIGSISPKFGVSVTALNEFRFRASFGAGFRAPTISEQFTDQVLSGFTVKPNRALRPERSYSFEAGGAFGNKWLQADAAVFYSRYNDLIEPGFVTSGTSPYIQFRNVTNAEIFGHEEFVEFFPFGNDLLSLRCAYTYIFPRDRTSKRILNFRPRHLIQARAAASIEAFELSSDFRYLSMYESVDPILVVQVPDGDARVAAYILDFRIGYDFKPLTDLPLKVVFQSQNLLNYYYVEIAGNMAPLRSFMLRLESTL